MTYMERVYFFLEHAGSGYRPDRESEFAGNVLGAMRLASAEEWKETVGAVADWELDTCTDSSDWDDENEPHELYACLFYVPCVMCPGSNIRYCDRKAHLHIQGSLGGVDFGPDSGPQRPYSRVIEAELALEAMS